MKRRIWYSCAFLTLLLAECLIALYVRDAFLRPYGGDILVTVLLCCLVRVIVPEPPCGSQCRTDVSRKSMYRARSLCFLLFSNLLPLWVFFFACAVELMQYLDVVSLLGLEDSTVLRIALGTTFSYADIICYGAGCLLFGIADFFIYRYSKTLPASN